MQRAAGLVLGVALGLTCLAPHATAQNVSATATRGGADVGTASTVVLAADATRKGLHVGNASDTRVWCAWGESAVANQGWFLDPGGFATYGAELRSVQALNCLHQGTGTKRVTFQVFR